MLTDIYMIMNSSGSFGAHAEKSIKKIKLMTLGPRINQPPTGRALKSLEYASQLWLCIFGSKQSFQLLQYLELAVKYTHTGRKYRKCPGCSGACRLLFTSSISPHINLI